jgi:glycosyltransferase involved in cell wall biosynthesis
MYHFRFARIMLMSSASAGKLSSAISPERELKKLRVPEPALVSVVIPCYNQAHFLHEAIENALAQTYSHREILVVDDGSTENIAEVAAGYPKVRYIRQENSGVSAARNTGLKQSRGEYLVFLDADDRLLPEALEIGVNYLREHPDCAFAAGCCRLIVADGSLLDDEPNHPHVASEHYLELLRGNYRIWCPGSVIYQRTAFDVVNGFDPSLGPGADYDLYLRITRDSPIFCHNRFVADYRLHRSSMSVDHLSMLREVLKALDSQWDFVKGRDSYVEAFETGKKHWQDYYQSLRMGDQILEVVEANLPPHATVAVATGGKRELLRLGARRAWHFPQTGADERGRLFQQGAKGSADVPWIQAGMRYEFRLFGGPKYVKQLAAISITGVPDATPAPAVAPVASGRACLIAVPNPVPAPNRFGRTTIAWNTGDGSEGRIYLSQGGEYDSRRPRDSHEAISRMEATRTRGAQYLLLPATAFWWLDQYPKFREHLESHCPVVMRDENTCIIFDLRESSQSDRQIR